MENIKVYSYESDFRKNFKFVENNENILMTFSFNKVEYNKCINTSNYEDLQKLMMYYIENNDTDCDLILYKEASIKELQDLSFIFNKILHNESFINENNINTEIIYVLLNIIYIKDKFDFEINKNNKIIESLKKDYIEFNEFDIVKIKMKLHSDEYFKRNYMIVCWPKGLKIKYISDIYGVTYNYIEKCFTSGVVDLNGDFINSGGNADMIEASIASEDEQIEFIEKMINSDILDNFNKNFINTMFKKYIALKNE